MPDDLAPVARAAGILFIAPDGRVLLMRRTEAATRGLWATPGGGIEEGETPEQAARREITEETGQTFDGELREWTHRIKDGVDFTTFIAEVEPFDPVLNAEHDAFVWVDRKAALDMPLHPGLSVVLLRFDMDELQIAKAMRSGDLTSPQKFGNVLLSDMRITGTGAAYRQGLDEFVWRDPSLYLNDEFLERCAGLLVILEHPDKGRQLNSKEFRERVAGTILLPYLKGDEVWGIAKIYDDAVSQMLVEQKLSTSPCVVFRSEGVESKYRMPDGATLLIEGKPSLLDHLAICELGVWDKGGAPSGVSNSDLSTPSGVIAMAEETTSKEEKGAEAKADASITASKEGDKLDTVLAHLDSLHKRMDSYEKATKADADEDCDMADADGEIEDEGDPMPIADRKGKKRADADEEDEAQPKKAKSDKARKDADEEEAKADKARADSVAALSTQIAELQKRIPVELPEADRARFVDAQAKAERVAQAFGDSAGAPRWVNGESLTQYRQRLLSKVKAHSDAWKDVDLSTMNDDALTVAEKQVYADAMSAALHPASVEGGRLRMVTETDDTGRRIRKFYGDPEACWGPFKQPSRIVTGWTTKFN